MLLLKGSDYDSQLNFATLPKLQVKIDGAKCIDWIVSTDKSFSEFFFVPRVEGLLSDRFSAGLCERKNDQLGGLIVEISTLIPECSRRVSLKSSCSRDVNNNSSVAVPSLLTYSRKDYASPLVYTTQAAQENIANGNLVSGITNAYERLRNALKIKIVRTGERKAVKETGAPTLGDVANNVTSMVQKQVQPLSVSTTKTINSVIGEDSGLNKLLSDDQFHEISSIMRSVTPLVGDPRLHKTVPNKVGLDQVRQEDARDSDVSQMEDSADLWEDSHCLHRIRNLGSGKSSSKSLKTAKIPSRSETWKMLDEAFVRPKPKSVHLAGNTSLLKTCAMLKPTEAITLSQQSDFSKMEQSDGIVASDGVSKSMCGKKAGKEPLFFYGKAFILSKEQPYRVPLVMVSSNPTLDPRITSNRKPHTISNLKILQYEAEVNLTNAAVCSEINPTNATVCCEINPTNTNTDTVSCVENRDSVSTSITSAQNSLTYCETQSFASRPSNEDDELKQFRGPRTPPEVEMHNQETNDDSSVVFGVDSVHHADFNGIKDLVNDMCARVALDCVAREEIITIGPPKESFVNIVVDEEVCNTQAHNVLNNEKSPCDVNKAEVNSLVGPQSVDGVSEEKRVASEEISEQICRKSELMQVTKAGAGIVSKGSFPNFIIKDHSAKPIEESLAGEPIHVQIGLCSFREPSFSWADESHSLPCLDEGHKNETRLLSDGELEESVATGGASVDSVETIQRSSANEDPCRSVDERLINLWMKMQKVRLENLESSSYHDGYMDGYLKIFQSELLMIRKMHFGITDNDQSFINLTEELLPKKISLRRKSADDVSRRTRTITISETSATEDDSGTRRSSKRSSARSRKRSHHSRGSHNNSDHSKTSSRCKSSSAKRLVSRDKSASSVTRVSWSSDSEAQVHSHQHRHESRRSRSRSMKPRSSHKRSVSVASTRSSSEVCSTSDIDTRYKSNKTHHRHTDQKKHSKTSSKHSPSRKKYVFDDDSRVNQRKRSKSASSRSDSSLRSESLNRKSRQRHESGFEDGDRKGRKKKRSKHRKHRV